MPAKQDVITEVATSVKSECELMDVIDVCGIIELLGEKQTIELSYSQTTESYFARQHLYIFAGSYFARQHLYNSCFIFW